MKLRHMPIDAMDEFNLDSFEKSILSDIKGIKPKSRQRGYAKELIKKLHSVIEKALTDGCSYEEIATAISNKKVKVSPTTLKRYHAVNKINESESIMSEVSDVKQKVSIESNPASFNTGDNSSDFQENTTAVKVKSTSTVKAVIEEEPKKRTPHLTGASLTDEDYMDDFNDY